MNVVCSESASNNCPITSSTLPCRHVVTAIVLDTGRYDPVTAATSPGWAEELAGSHTPETEEYGIRSVTDRADRPFHPARLSAALED